MVQVTMQETQEMKETQAQFLGWEDPLEEEMTTCSSSYLQNPMDRIPWTEGYSLWGHK